ncbi:hypothetical protein JXJ21_19355 [candidate division KSB1 bacterium]|nr:hypothetical protein [candidate division KSB1 bacterium]
MRAVAVAIFALVVLCYMNAICQIQIEDVSPNYDNFNTDLGARDNAASGVGLCIAVSADGRRCYLGGNSGVWRSDDGGETWWQPTRPQPPAGETDVPGALLVPNVYDLLISPANNDIVLAAIGRDARVPAESGIYLSTDGALSWSRVHQFSYSIGTLASSLAVAPDDPQHIYAAGGTALALSTDGGITWTQKTPGIGSFWHVVAGPQGRVYAVGSSVWHSQDYGANWDQDPMALNLGAPSNRSREVGPSSRALAIHPTNPDIIYLTFPNVGLDSRFPDTPVASIWRGDFSTVLTNSRASWRRLPTVDSDYAGTTDSGGDFIVPHVAPDGKFYLLVSDRRTTHIWIEKPNKEEPNDVSDWERIDGVIHVDPHNLAMTPNFQYGGGGSGRIFIVNDGGVYFSTDGIHWTPGKNLSTLNLVNVAVLPRPGKEPAICIQTAHNNGFYSMDGGATWETQDYVGGDNDISYGDPRQPSRLVVFAPREKTNNVERQVFLYSAVQADEIPDATYGTNQRQRIPGPPPLPNAPKKAPWNTVSWFYVGGYRPLILTPVNESPLPDGDFVTIRFRDQGQNPLLLRTTKLSQITTPNDWLSTATSDGPSIKVFQQGPELPNATVDVVQASGGHDAPVFYVSDRGIVNDELNENIPSPIGLKRLWKWSEGMTEWQRIVPPDNGNQVPAVAERFFVDPYRPNLLYILDKDHILRSDDGGTKWEVDTGLEKALTENGAFPINIPFDYDGHKGTKLVMDMVFDPEIPEYRFAMGPAGVFYTIDGINWDHLVRTSALPMRPNNAVYDYITDPRNPALYVATNNRGLLRLSSLPKATLMIEFKVLPKRDPGVFSFQIDGVNRAANISDKRNMSFRLSGGTHKIGVSAQPNTRLSDYVVVFGGDCDSDGNFSIGVGETKTCFVTMLAKSGKAACRVMGEIQRDLCLAEGIQLPKDCVKYYQDWLTKLCGPLPQQPKLAVRLRLLPPDDPGKFNLQINGITRANNVGNGGTTGPVGISVGAHKIAITAGNNTNLENYFISFSDNCLPDGTILIPATPVFIPGGYVTTCTTTVSGPQITLKNRVVPLSDPGKFNLQIDGITRKANIGNGEITVSLSPGVHRIGVTSGTNTNVADYTTTIAGDCVANGTITLAYGDKKTCTITNTAKSRTACLKECERQYNECLKRAKTPNERAAFRAILDWCKANCQK